MENLILTKEGILKDIEGYQQRIEGARLKLSTMPATVEAWKDRKKANRERHILTEEIAHVYTLIGCARETLKEL